MYTYEKSETLRKEVETIERNGYELQTNKKLANTIILALGSFESKNHAAEREQKYKNHEDAIFKSLVNYSAVSLFTYLYLTNRSNLININFEEIPYGLRGGIIHLMEASVQKTKADVLKVFIAHYESQSKDNLSMVD